jgi:hypothetical protein
MMTNWIVALALLALIALAGWQFTEIRRLQRANSHFLADAHHLETDLTVCKLQLSACRGEAEKTNKGLQRAID